MHLYSVYWGIGLCGEHLKELYTVKIALPPQTKTYRRGGGLRQINTCRQVPLLVNFWEKPTFRVWCRFKYLVLWWLPHRGTGCERWQGFDPRLNQCSVNSLLLAGQMNGFPQGANPSNRPDSPFIALGREFGFETDCSLVLTWSCLSL